MNETESILVALASGSVGALLATGLAALFDRWKEQARLRADVLLQAVGWADDVYLRIIDMHVAKNAAYTGGKQYLAGDDYAANSRELRSALLRSSLLARVGVVYGEGEETAALNKLRGSLLQAAQILWRSKADSWSSTHTQLQSFLASEVDPCRAAFERRLFESAGRPMRWLGLHARQHASPWSPISGADTSNDAMLD
jgi:hypothetical protein